MGADPIVSKEFDCRLRELAKGDDELRRKSIQLRKMRNSIVHGAEEARPKDAKLAIDVAAKLLPTQRKHDMG